MVGQVVPRSSSRQGLVQTALQTLDVERKARDAGLLKHPPTESTTLDANQQEILAYFSNKCRDRRAEVEKELDAARGDRQTTRAKIDIEQTRHAFSTLINAINPAIQS